MNTLCALIASTMLYCGGNDFRPVNDFDQSFQMTSGERAGERWGNQYGGGTYNGLGGHTYTPGCWSCP